MGETLAIAFLGTLIATVAAFPISFLAARNTSPHGVLRFAIRRCLDTIRGIDALIWALVFVGVVGLGPFAGILAIAVSDTGALGKLFSEAIESTEERARESVLASGGTSLLAVRFGLLPQVLPIIAGQILYFFESNVRSATIIGIVGAGGIGLQLSEQIRTYDFDQVAFAVIMILVTVAVIDWISSKLRFAIIGRARDRSRASANQLLPAERVENVDALAHTVRHYVLHHEFDALGGKARAGRQQWLAVGIDVGAVDHQHRTPEREVEPRGVGGVRRWPR